MIMNDFILKSSEKVKKSYPLCYYTLSNMDNVSKKTKVKRYDKCSFYQNNRMKCRDFYKPISKLLEI